MLTLEMIRTSVILAASGAILVAAYADYERSDENPEGRKFLHKRYMDDDFAEEQNPGMAIKASRSRAPVKRIEYMADTNQAAVLKDDSGIDEISKTSTYGSRSIQPRVIQHRRIDEE